MEKKNKTANKAKPKALVIQDVSQQSEPLFDFSKIEKQLLKNIEGNGKGIMDFMSWLKSNYGG